MNKNKWFLNGGRGSGRTIRLLCETYENKIAELEEKISVLLSCKNCPENKGGFICVKEYENKCLAQKIQYIKELQEENAELKEQCSILADCNTCISACKTENIEMKKQLTKAKELLAKWVELFKPKLEGYPITTIQEQAEQFLSEVEK